MRQVKRNKVMQVTAGMKERLVMYGRIDYRQSEGKF